MESILKAKFRDLALHTRYELGFTQKRMSELLMMNENSYSDIETGKAGCGELTIVLLLIMADDPKLFLHELDVSFKEAYEAEVEFV